MDHLPYCPVISNFFNDNGIYWTKTESTDTFPALASRASITSIRRTGQLMYATYNTQNKRMHANVPCIRRENPPRRQTHGGMIALDPCLLLFMYFGGSWGGT